MKSKFNIRTNHKLRLEAFDMLQKLKNENVSRQEIVNKINKKFGIPIVTAYDWYRNKHLPYGRRGDIVYRAELFYVLGALLGDGCVYNWKTTNNYVILIGDKSFTTKYANMLTLCIGKKSKPYIDRSKNVWFVRSNNFKLYYLFKRIRKDINYLENLMNQNDECCKVLFIEGFFDAEGCVKIIKEKIRKTPKICLDVTNTNYEFLELVRKLLKEQLNIESKYSIQEYKNNNKKTTYHLRIYKKEYVKRFFENISTTKLKEEKVIYLKNWLNSGE